jgi:cyclase
MSEAGQARLRNVRMIAVLLLEGEGFVKTVRFRRPDYLGDPFNIVRIFNEKGVDELAILDIGATHAGRSPDFGLLGELADECFMPVSYGGGIRSLDDCRRLLKAGFEKIVVNSRLIEAPQFATEIAATFGAQALIASIDAKRRRFGGYRVMARSGRHATRLEPVAWARELARRGAGEILLTAIDRDGTMVGYDEALVQSVAAAVDVPVIACGGAGAMGHLVSVVLRTDAASVAAGAMFVYYGPHRAVLINPPSQDEFERELLAAARRVGDSERTVDAR